MIGHQLNGCRIVAAVPSSRETYTILAVRIPGHPDAPGDEFVTASVHVSQLPKPEFWHNGHYFRNLSEACSGFLDRSQTTTTHMAKAIEDALLALWKAEAPEGVAPIIEKEST